MKNEKVLTYDDKKNVKLALTKQNIPKLKFWSFYFRTSYMVWYGA